MAEKTQEQAREISARLREAAGMRNWVQPVLVFDNDVRGKRDPDGVHVVGLPMVVDYLTEMPRELDDDEVKHVGRVLHDDATWPFANPPKPEVRKRTRPVSRKEVRKRLLVAGCLAVSLWVIASIGGKVLGPDGRASPEKLEVRKKIPAKPAPNVGAAEGERSPRVEAIRARYQAVGSSQWKLTKVEKHISGMSAEGSSLVGYLDDGTLRKAEWTIYGEGGQQLSEMMFHGVRLEFVFQKTQSGGTGGRARPESEKRYYLAGGNIIWATQGKSRVPMSPSEVLNAQPGLLEMGARAVAALNAQGDRLTYDSGKFVSPLLVPPPMPPPEPTAIPPPMPLPEPAAAPPPFPPPEPGGAPPPFPPPEPPPH